MFWFVASQLGDEEGGCPLQLSPLLLPLDITPQVALGLPRRLEAHDNANIVGREPVGILGLPVLLRCHQAICGFFSFRARCWQSPAICAGNL